MASYNVEFIFNDGVNSYTFPIVYRISDPKEGMKATVIDGNRGDGSIIIPGGKKSQRIVVEGYIVDSDGYKDITDRMADMKTKVSTNPATLTMRHWTGATWQNDWQYTVRRIDEIDFPESLRTDSQKYQIEFLVSSY